MTRQTFFEDAVLERDLGDDFLRFPVLASQIFDRNLSTTLRQSFSLFREQSLLSLPLPLRVD